MANKAKCTQYSGADLVHLEKDYSPQEQWIGFRVGPISVNGVFLWLATALFSTWNLHRQNCYFAIRNTGTAGKPLMFMHARGSPDMS